MSYAVLFPGQGSQFVGMGVDLFAAQSDLLGDRADAIVGFSLQSVALDGPAEVLTRTEHAQPSLFALSYALWVEFATVAPPPVAAAGHSLGEYSALAAAHALDYPTALGLVAERGRAMAEAADANPSAMAAVIGADLDTVEETCAGRRQAGGELWVANINAPGQVVVAGGEADVAWLGENGRDLGIRRVIPLAVAGAFHTPLMDPATVRLAGALEEVTPGEPDFPVYSNVTAAPHTAPDMRDRLIEQVVSPVRFSESLEAIAALGVDTFVHVGPGDVTAGLAKRTVDGARTLAVSTMADIAPVARSLGTMH